MNPGTIIVLVVVAFGLFALFRYISRVRQGARIEAAFRKGMGFDEVASSLHCSKKTVHRHCQRLARDDNYVAAVDAWLEPRDKNVI